LAVKLESITKKKKGDKHEKYKAKAKEVMATHIIEDKIENGRPSTAASNIKSNS